MTLKNEYTSAEEVPENLKEFYAENNGKFLFVGAEGWKPMAEVEKLSKALESERSQRKQFQGSASAWESKFTGKTPDEIFAQLERIPLLEAESQGKVDQKRHTEIIETTVKQRMAPLEHEITKLKQSVVEREQEIAQFKASEHRRTLHDAVRGVAVKEGFQESTYNTGEGALMLLAERHFTINSVGDVVVADESKLLTPGLGLREALVEIKNHYPYMVKQSLGGGAQGSNGAGGNGAGGNPFKSNDMTARGKFMAEHRKDPQKIEFMYKQAGLPNPYTPYNPKG